MYIFSQDSGVDVPGSHDSFIFSRFNKGNVFNMNEAPCKKGFVT